MLDTIIGTVWTILKWTPSMHSLDVVLIVRNEQIQRLAVNVLLDSLCLLENVYPAAMVATLVTQHKLAHHVHLGIF